MSQAKFDIFNMGSLLSYVFRIIKGSMPKKMTKNSTIHFLIKNNQQIMAISFISSLGSQHPTFFENRKNGPVLYMATKFFPENFLTRSQGQKVALFNVENKSAFRSKKKNFTEVMIRKQSVAHDTLLYNNNA